MENALTLHFALQFFAYTLCLGLFGKMLGVQVEKHVTAAKKPLYYRLMINAIVLYALITLLPPNIIRLQLQDTMPGLLFCATFFNSQSWNW